MRRFDAMLLVTVFVAAGCGAAVSGGSAEGGKAQVAGGTTAATTRPAFDAPATVFTPRSHPPRSRFASVPAPNLASLPALRMRLGECFGLREKEEAAKIAGPSGGGVAQAKKAKGGGSLGNVGSGSGGGGYTSGAVQPSAPVSKPATQPRAEARSAPAKPAEALAGASMRAPSPPPPSAAVPAQAASPAADSSSFFAKSSPAPSEQPADGNAEVAASPVRIAGGEEPVAPPPNEDDRYEDWGQAIYLSNDDSMSLSSAQRVIYAIDNFLPLPLEHIRPHELLNYFSFETAQVEQGDDFSVLADMGADDREPGIYTLALSVRGRTVDKTSRRNAEITFVVDRSGSMSDEGRMSYLKRGLSRMVDELKTGDIVHLVVFDHQVCVPMESFAVGRDDLALLRKAIDAIEPRGSTDLHQGLARGYEIADRAYQAEYTNRVVLITDALANTGVTDERTISMISKYYDTRRIRLSGVGVGREFNDALLDRLTERGKGAYVFLGSEAEVDAVFGRRFISLIETTALDVHFLLHLPPSLRMNVFYGEESSTVKEDVQAIHYFANTSQLFLSDLMARGKRLRPQDGIMLGIEYEDPETGENLNEEYAFTLKEIEGQALNVKKGRIVMAWIDLLAQLAARPAPYSYGPGEGGWEDEQGWQMCDDGKTELKRLAEGLNDPEVRRVLDLFDKYCSRYERPRHPVKRQIAAPGESWPSAQPSPTR
ncbi:MAG: VWA domain-containing protein [Deltaproteobacteria bacterium]|nr:VWA domain-containing protein [Deltaproteobacteria bacterium]